MVTNPGISLEIISQAPLSPQQANTHPCGTQSEAGRLHLHLLMDLKGYEVVGSCSLATVGDSQRKAMQCMLCLPGYILMSPVAQAQ